MRISSWERQGIISAMGVDMPTGFFCVWRGLFHILWGFSSQWCRDTLFPFLSTGLFSYSYFSYFSYSCLLGAASHFCWVAVVFSFVYKSNMTFFLIFLHLPKGNFDTFQWAFAILLFVFHLAGLSYDGFSRVSCLRLPNVLYYCFICLYVLYYSVFFIVAY